MDILENLLDKIDDVVVTTTCNYDLGIRIEERKCQKTLKNGRVYIAIWNMEGTRIITVVVFHLDGSQEVLWLDTSMDS